MNTILEKDMSLFKDKIQQYKNTKAPLLPVLHLAQDMFRHIPVEIQEVIQKEFRISNAHINGVISFYEQFYTTPTGKNHIGICSGTSCHIQKSKLILLELEKILGIKDGETTKDGMFTIIPVKCVGKCDTAPNLLVNDDVYENVSVSDINNIINNLK